ncbi:MAG: CusA/CzcA family heavy metal efflux RND transporter [Owenweeksia sp.]|nr:CusA/CzcA family heavy metal efflux RND transporter [Owenweeksia sp.]MBF99296.1 CusA/CzcA family heavy metal efflux RND transporter [Owenweeksia sp.]
MINNIIAFSIKNKLIIGLFSLALIVAGLWSMTEVPIDAVPDITNNQVQVITQAPNLGTEDIEQFVTYPVEVAMANLPGVSEIRSISRFGLSVVTIVFEDNMGTYLPRQLVSEKLTQVKEDIPEGFGESFIGPISTGLGEIYQYTLSVHPDHVGEYSAMELRTIQDWIVRRQMAMVPGVVEVNAFGGAQKQYEVAVNPDELRAIGLTIADVFRALEQNNRNTGGAYIEKDHHANFIRGEGLARSIADIENIVVKTVDNVPVRVRDVAQVQLGHAMRYGAFTKDGNGEAVGGMILMLKGANSNKVIEAVKERVNQIQASLPEGIRIEPFLDRSTLIAETTGTVTTNLLEGALIVIFVLVFLLGNWRGGLIVASTIPLSLLFAFVLMNVFDVWANLMSLGAIDFGIIVDGAVIIVEGTVFFLVRELQKSGSVNPEKRDEISNRASAKMMNSAFFGQLIILIVFLPILFLQGVEGKMFQPMALTFMFAMLGAMLLCLTYVPMMSSLFLRVSKKQRASWGDRLVQWLENHYERGLQRALKKQGWIIGSALVLMVAAIFTFSRMGAEFIPQLDEGDMAFHAILKPGSSLSETIETTTKIERLIKAGFPEVKHIMSRIGVADVPTDPMPMDIADIFVILKPRSEWTSAHSKEELIAKMKETVNLIPGVNYEFTQPIEMRFNELLTGVREDVAVKLYGEDLDILARKAEEMGRIIATVDGVGDMKVEATTGLPQITVDYQRNKLAQYGLNISDLNRLIETAFAGGKAGVIFEGEKRFDLVVRLGSGSRGDIDDLKQLYVNTAEGAQIPLKEVAHINYEPGPMQISRDNTNRRTYVGVNVRGRDVKSLVQDIRQKLDEQLDLPAGYYIRYGGAFENLERATNRLQLVVPLALALIFILIFFALRSVKQSLMIYIAIPLAAVGGVFSLWVRGMPFSISAGVGFIVLFGVAVLNGLVLISGWNELKEDGETNVDQRIRKGARRRIRPILLTALTDILGFLPMALSTSSGAEVQRPLATVVIGGLLTSTLLTLFVLPVLYQWIERRESTRLKTPVAVLILVIGLLSPNLMRAQNMDSIPSLSLEGALKMAVENYPQLKASRLEVENQEALRKTAWNLGKTQVFTGGEEIGPDGNGVYTTLGVQQQNMNVFGVAPQLRAGSQRVALAETALDLSELEVSRQVKLAYAEAYMLYRKAVLYRQLDSVYQSFEKGARLRYESEETSRLAYLAASNQVKRIALQKKQVEYDFGSALYRLNLWLVSDTFYTVEPEQTGLWDKPLVWTDAPLRHPALAEAFQRVELANAERRVANASFLPKLNAQYGIQQIAGQGGYYQYQVGVTIPLFFMEEQGAAQSARLKQQIAEQEFLQKQLEFQTRYRNLRQEYLKWQESWSFCREETLPLAREQRKGSVLAFQEGELDYTAFIQNLREALQTELDAMETQLHYLQARSELEFYLDTNKP